MSAAYHSNRANLSPSPPVKWGKDSKGKETHTSLKGNAFHRLLGLSAADVEELHRTAGFTAENCQVHFDHFLNTRTNAAV